MPQLRNSTRTAAALLALAAALASPLVLTGFGRAETAAARFDSWSRDEVAVLASMSIRKLPAPPTDPSNAVAERPEAVSLGKRLFADPRLSRNGAVSCASCHAPDRQFQDGLPVGQGVGTGRRRTMPIAATAYSPWLFWDGRKDSPWSQALGPLEDGVEHGGNRVRFARVLQAHYRQDYEALFGAMPRLEGLPGDASPLGSSEEKQAWGRMTGEQQDQVNRLFANLGKAIAAYERTITYGPSRFDRYVDGVTQADRSSPPALSAQEVQGLRLFIGKAQCATCHNGPLFTDQAFHNTGVPARDPAHPDRGRGRGAGQAKVDEFNCLGRYSDAPREACQELAFMATDDPALEGAFKTPSLRNVELRAPYMHAGQFETLDDVLGHYVRSPRAAVGHSELAHAGEGHAGRQPIRLSEQEMRDVVAFLRSLSGPVEELAGKHD
ncbi:cytochrome-c peroxidase [Ideonella sp. YS5]|uniref:cytochrome-c peroxidase n=1 Tax=Ideonella sp. YS5 TaxID=3453714 RepID=UPI003EED9916